MLHTQIHTQCHNTHSDSGKGEIDASLRVRSCKVTF